MTGRAIGATNQMRTTLLVKAPHFFNANTEAVAIVVATTETARPTRMLLAVDPSQSALEKYSANHRNENPDGGNDKKTESLKAVGTITRLGNSRNASVVQAKMEKLRESFGNYFGPFARRKRRS